MRFEGKEVYLLIKGQQEGSLWWQNCFNILAVVVDVWAYSLYNTVELNAHTQKYNKTWESSKDQWIVLI